MNELGVWGHARVCVCMLTAYVHIGWCVRARVRLEMCMCVCVCARVRVCVCVCERLLVTHLVMG